MSSVVKDMNGLNSNEISNELYQLYEITRFVTVCKLDNNEIKEIVEDCQQLIAQIDESHDDKLISHKESLLQNMKKYNLAFIMEDITSVLDDSSEGMTRVANIVKDLNFRSALVKVSKLYEDKVEHPKLIELQKILDKEIKENSNKI